MTQSMQPRYRPDIDGLRAVAVLAVVGFHAFPNRYFEWGFIGVDIFFVISGFLISSIIFANLSNNSFSYLDFYSRRIRRIFPALVLVLACGLLFGWLGLLPNEYYRLGLHIGSGAAFVSNFTLWNEAGYFDGASAGKPLLHLWSLGIEEQFYLVWPLLLGIFQKRGISLLAVTVVVLAASFIANILIAPVNPVAGFYSPASRFWELMIGCVLAYLAVHKVRFLDDKADWKATAGVLLLIIAAVAIDKDKPYPGWWALLPTLGTFFIIAAGPTAWVNKRVLSSRMLVGIGLISYPLYLWHWPLLSVLHTASSGTPSVEMRTAAVICALILAWLTYRLVETPIRRNAPDWAAYTGWLLGLMLLCGLGGIGIYGYGKQANTVQVGGKDRGQGPASTSESAAAPTKRLTSLDTPQIISEILADKNDDPMPQDVALSWKTGECFKNSDTDASAVFGPACVEAHRRPLILIWGDSHAAAVTPGFRALQMQHDFGVAQLTASSCPPLFDLKVYTNGRHCTRYLDEALSIIGKVKPDIVLLHADWANKPENLKLLSHTVKRLRAVGARKIVLLGAAPRWPTKLSRLVFNEWERDSGKKPPPYYLPAADPVVPESAFVDLARSLDIGYISTTDVLCNAQGCLTRTGDSLNRLTSFDKAHLSVSGAQYLAEKIVPALLSSVPK